MKFIAIIIGKIVCVVGKLLKRGSSLPGEIALKIDKNLLTKFKLPKTIIAVTGSSGKGSTSSVIAKVYSSMGYKVVYNESGANLTPGITTMLLENCSLTGKVDKDVIVFEMDERYAKFVFPYVTPTHIVVTNITRDQPPRQGNVDLVYNEIKRALPQGCHLILNGDDPYLMKFNIDNEYAVTYYGIDKNEWSYTENKFKNLNMYYCPKCNTKLDYAYYNFETLGEYKCPKCDFNHPECQYHATHLDYNNYNMTVNGIYELQLQYDLLYNAYNTLAAFTTACVMGLDSKEVCRHINQLNANNKTYNHYLYNDKEVYVLNNKNENSTTFNQSILFTERFKDIKTIVIGWKEISRRYNFEDLSWMYDVDFEILNTMNTENIVCVGPNAYDIATRVKLAGIDVSKIAIYDTLKEAKEHIDKTDSKYIFAILNFDYVNPFKSIFKNEEDEI